MKTSRQDVTESVRDCGQKNVNTWSPMDNDTPGQTESSDRAPDCASDSASDSAPTNSTSPGYTEREKDNLPR